jgi:vitamin B12 transporter
LRAYGARGYSLPNTQFQHDNLSTTKTFQAGIETTAIPSLWLKGTFFHNRLDDVEQTNNPVLSNQTKQGFELEGRTTPWHGLSLTGGYTFLDAKDRDTHERLQTTGGQAVPRQSLKLGLNYDQKDLGLRGALTGNYVWWDAAQNFDTQGRYSAMVWDLHLNWQLFPQKETSPELFFSIRNLFNGDQSADYLKYPNAPRWLELGVRFKF